MATAIFIIYLEKTVHEPGAHTPDRRAHLLGVRDRADIGLVYYNARNFLRGSNPLHGLLAAGFFLSYPIVVDYSGEPAVDLTAMLMVTLYITAYLYGLRRPKSAITPDRDGNAGLPGFQDQGDYGIRQSILVGYLFEESGRWNWRRLLDLLKP
jgi:hypothetical protein